MKVILTKGLPGSGKSTWAKEWVAKKPTERVRINKDDLRAMLHTGKYSKGNESQILRIEEEIIIDSLYHGKSVVVDNTHLATTKDGKNRHFERIKDLVRTWARKNDYDEMKSVAFELKEFNLSPEECIKRDLQRPNSVGQDVIWRMYWDHVAVIEKQEVSPTKKDAIIVDMDGTLASMDGKRGPFQWDKVGLDSVHAHIRNIVCTFDNFYNIIIVTGRDGVAAEASKDWLIKHDIPFDEFFIRPEGDCRKDFIIKREIYEDNIKPYYNIHLVIDDRPQVIREWRRLGLPVINANPIDRDF